MLKVFIPSRLLLDIYYENGNKKEKEQSPFFRLLKLTHDIYITGVDLNNYGLFNENDVSDARFLRDMEVDLQVVLHNADSFINEIKDDHSKVLEEACAAFYIYDITPDEAAMIQNDYGVICQSANDPVNMDLYMQPMETYDLTKYEVDNINDKKWKDIFDLPHDVPSNAVCIIDRNLFTYDGQPATRIIDGMEQNYIKKDGLINLYSILNQALPLDFKGNSFDVLILFEQESIKGVFTFENLSQIIFNVIDDLKRSYPVNTSIIAFRHGNNKDIKSAKYYNELTHTRQIISNYYRISAENGLNTTMSGEDNRNNIGKSYYSQVLYSMLLFSSGLRRGGADPADKSIQRIVNDFRKFLKYWKDNPDTDEYKIATSTGGISIFDYENRLFV